MKSVDKLPNVGNLNHIWQLIGLFGAKTPFSEL
jgi:hypothetical protein